MCVQVDELAKVFQDEYKFTTTKRYLERDPPQAEMNKHLADFVYENDAKNTLLIVYYAGHGWSNPSKPDIFHLHK
jgi:hypothetical protein